MRLVIAQCQVDYVGRLTAHLPMATRLILVKADGSVSVHADDRAYKPLNWMSPPCTLSVTEPDAEAVEALGVTEVWQVKSKDGDTLRISLAEVLHDTAHELGIDPGLQKDGVEAHLQVLLAEHPATLGDGLALVQREYLTPIGPVDLLLRDTAGHYVAVEVKRRGEIDGVEQLTRYLELMNRDPALAPVRGIFAGQQIKPQARTLAVDRGIECRLIDYDALRGMDNADERLF
ncbi:endonuclease [Tessaracoccus aquimaris]|uniref:Endonuclease NucS n=1 Tax=Tessaracoccus aquimaris TaxID=1332264 RepID=A0A1Q2CM85_9ACTN|nr:endonuclease NucS [Tessaracoccus aquimaris]AQP47216.1 endonuclease [Tessaracoccus aquimaris]